jgi:hypothetical protein
MIRGVVSVLCLGLAGAAQASVSEVHILPTVAKQPRWVYGEGAVQLTAWSAGYTSWGSMGSAVDLLLGPDFTTTPTMMTVELEPVLSLPKVLGRPLPEGLVLSDVGLTAQLKGSIINERFQPMPLSLLVGPSLEFGGAWIDGLRLDLMWRMSRAYEESYEIPFLEGNGTITMYPYDDVWPVEPGLSFGLEGFHTWSLSRMELFARGFVDVWQQDFTEVEQWPEYRPDEVSAGPTWAVESSAWRLLAQPQLGVRVGKKRALVLAVELELAHQLYMVPETDLSMCTDPISADEGSYCLQRDPLTVQVGPVLGLRF